MNEQRLRRVLLNINLIFGGSNLILAILTGNILLFMIALINITIGIFG